jgi:tetratricopeptide (TPR) repeat protein
MRPASSTSPPGKLYEAATEFEWARKFLPGYPDPRINLALCMERAGRTEEARQAYDSALEVAPESLAAKQGAAVLAVRRGQPEPRLDSWLARIALESERADWRDWANDRASGR